jgi:hypothetical protein
MSNEKIYNDFTSMLGDIKSHVSEHGGHIVQDDKPMKLQIGYRCEKTNEQWRIGITKLKNTSLSEHNQTPLDLKMLGTEDGKAKLLDMINSSSL